MDVNKVVQFYNPLNEDFEFRWDKAPYRVAAKEKVYFPAFLAYHGAKHLTDKIILHPELWPELNLQRPDKGDRLDANGDPKNPPDLSSNRAPIMQMIIVSEEIVSAEKPKTASEKLQEEIAQINEREKQKKTEGVKKTEEEFPELAKLNKKI